jgi:hypothetical protein
MACFLAPQDLELLEEDVPVSGAGLPIGPASVAPGDPYASGRLSAARPPSSAVRAAAVAAAIAAAAGPSSAPRGDPAAAATPAARALPLALVTPGPAPPPLSTGPVPLPLSRSGLHHFLRGLGSLPSLAALNVRLRACEADLPDCPCTPATCFASGARGRKGPPRPLSAELVDGALEPMRVRWRAGRGRACMPAWMQGAGERLRGGQAWGGGLGGGKSCGRQEETRAVDAAQWSGCRACKACSKATRLTHNPDTPWRGAGYPGAPREGQES